VPSEDATVSSKSDHVETEMAFGDQLLLLASIIDALESEAKLMVRLLKYEWLLHLRSRCLDPAGWDLILISCIE